ncbi:TetR family transcriptional regulator [Sinorhizobium medicae]|uniref:TetR/AcrR family transcriptional regulator n=1 Tax=Sinorhizobium medicae TaxID=110321 RepID=UPI000C79B797|nr:TetR/AcrR family transcriptional regulator [Sinorhizobium medicae]MDX0524317.1 TetR family transcriptional regulator [Sinorhizobium medicae]MDX0635950.1 TetR family transcriptional regulator [Sinorhizobium medicae]MDX0695657.1 TetR family transcriptional regulator [Sinorhizobium medicae]MDX0772714.1 TetR family transcriptional regulator [Sinorhizobium medicae]MDX0906966.1 TetR family transcriptional regulator [Sinorhizobium medicae]
MNIGSTSPRPVGRPREFDMNQALDAAIRIFSEKGYHGTSIAELKAEMGLTAGSIYKAFRDKRDVFVAAYDRYKQIRADLLDQALSSASTGREKIARVVRFYAMSACGETGRRGCLAIGAAVELVLSDTVIADKVGGHNRKLVARLEGFVRDGQLDGSIRQDVDPAPTALALFSYLQGVRIAGKTGELENQMLPSAEALLRILD